jgi:hypothetical protein
MMTGIDSYLHVQKVLFPMFHDVLKEKAKNLQDMLVLMQEHPYETAYTKPALAAAQDMVEVLHGINSHAIIHEVLKDLQEPQQ